MLGVNDYCCTSNLSSEPTTAVALRARLAEREAVFEAQVVRLVVRTDSVPRTDAQAGPAWRTQTLIATVRTHAVWKGDVSGEVTVTTPAPTTACGADLRMGERYLFFATRLAEGELFVTKCDPPRRSNDATGLRQLLQELHQHSSSPS